MWRSDELTIRLATRNDLPDIVALLEDPEVARWLWFGPNSSEVTEEFFGPLLDAQNGEAIPSTAVFTVFEKDEYVGEAAVVVVEGSPAGYEIGYQFTKHSWGRGIGTRVSRFLLAYVVVLLDAHRVQASCLAGNEASTAILRNLGLELEGLRPEFRLMRGERHDELLFGARVSDLDRNLIEQWAKDFGLTIAKL